MKFNDPSEFFKFILEKYDINGINDNQKCLALALDLLDSGKSYFKLLKISFDNNVYKELIKAYNADSNVKKHCVDKAIKILNENCFIEKEKAVLAVSWLAGLIYPTEWSVFQRKYDHDSEDKSVSSKEIIKDNNQTFEEKNIKNIHLNTDSDKKVKRAMLALEDGDFVRADDFAEDALDLDPENPSAYLVKLLIEYKIQKLDDLVTLPKSFDGSNNFKKVIRFADKNLKDKMIDLVEERRKYSIYKEAVSYVSDTSVDSNKKAIQLFKSIIDFKDSKDRYLKCEYNLKLIPYKKACELMNNNSVEDNYKAIKIFESLEDFKDSKNKILKCETNIKKIPYKEACNLMSKTSIDSNLSAIEIFESIIDYKDSKDKFLECAININEIAYNKACNLMSKTSIDSNLSAIKIFESIIDFKDSRQKIEECNISISSIKGNERIQRLNIYNEIINNMVECPAGEFLMGSPEKTVKSEGFLGFFREVEEAEMGRSNDELQHKVILTKSFKIGKYPVTQKEYEVFMGNNPSRFRGENRPVESVSWNDAKEFCEKLNKYSNNIPQGYKFDLPTEAQWEYACRAGTTTSLNSGKNVSSETGSCINLDEVGWYLNNSGSETHDVGLKKPNAWGIYDMHGNVWEWCRDFYNDYSSLTVTDPICNSGSYRVNRGGSWIREAKCCRSAYRCNCLDDRYYDLGFRLALVPIEKG